MPTAPGQVEWYDSPDVHDRRKWCSWWPSGTERDGEPLGTVYVAERESPDMTWPPARELAHEATLEVAAAIARDRGLS